MASILLEVAEPFRRELGFRQSAKGVTPVASLSHAPVRQIVRQDIFALTSTRIALIFLAIFAGRVRSAVDRPVACTSLAHETRCDSTCAALRFVTRNCVRDA